MSAHDVNSDSSTIEEMKLLVIN